MKLDIQDIVGGITAVRQKIGADLVEWSPYFNWGAVFVEKLNNIGEIEDIDLCDIDICIDETLQFVGKKVLVYIRDRKIHPNYGLQLPKFHIANCKTLQQAISDNNYDKYVASTKMDDQFTIRGIYQSGKTTDSVKKLMVCKNCLEQLNYKNYANDYRLRNVIYTEFSIKEFFEQYRTTDIIQPKYNVNTAPTNNYPEYWRTISRQRKRVKNFTCESCHINLTITPNFLQVHHKNKIKYDNRPENLEVLCIDCHSKQGADHAQIKNKPEYIEFMKSYRRRSSQHI